MTDQTNQTLQSPLISQELMQSLFDTPNAEQKAIEELCDEELESMVTGAVGPESLRRTKSLPASLDHLFTPPLTPRNTSPSVSTIVQEQTQELKKSFYTNHKPFVQKVSAASMYGAIGGAIATMTKK